MFTVSLGIKIFVAHNDVVLLARTIGAFIGRNIRNTQQQLPYLRRQLICLSRQRIFRSAQLAALFLKFPCLISFTVAMQRPHLLRKYLYLAAHIISLRSQHPLLSIQRHHLV